MNALERVGNGRTDIEWNASVTDRTLGKFLRHISITSGVRWEIYNMYLLK